MCTLFVKCDGIWTMVYVNTLYYVYYTPRISFGMNKVVSCVLCVSPGDRGECAGVQGV